MVRVRRMNLLLQLLGTLLLLAATTSLTSHAKNADEVDLVALPPRPPIVAPSPHPVLPFPSGVAIEGVVYCLTCTVMGRAPMPSPSALPGVVAKLQCDRPKHGRQTYGNATTDAKGYFLLIVPKMKPTALRMCKVVLTLPTKCDKPLLPSLGLAKPLFERIEKIGSLYYVLYTAGFSEYAPPRPLLCHL
ncbi:uncharacterized protein M6B38_351890 [Iris pallida]|uniref:Pistil-specific extensin-like protein n=1 Tax=Iris pallida TaxID=29817 RepID=A0AAX6GRP6_IRIPA|nr:uncharacterized protein M6B38_351890 [Iris pallida]